MFSRDRCLTFLWWLSSPLTINAFLLLACLEGFFDFPF